MLISRRNSLFSKCLNEGQERLVFAKLVPLGQFFSKLCFMIKIEGGGVCFPKGFSASGVKAGIKASGNLDLALLYSKEAARCFEK
jgi:hypothetical protein